MTYTSIIIGTGFSGIAMAIKLKEKGIHDFVMLEKADAVGGTWRENTYPGAECDIPSVLYSFSFAPYPFWNYKWSTQDQILEYINTIVDQYDLRSHIHFQKEMIGATWRDKQGIWTVQLKEGEDYQTKTLIPAIGQLHHPSIPDFKGKDTFQGPNFHSARWDHAIDLKGKTIGVIGNAASATQFIPEIAKVAKEVVVFQRSANWMLPKLDRQYKNWEKKLVKRFPFLFYLYRWSLWLQTGALFLVLKKGNGLFRSIFEKLSLFVMKRKIKDPNLIEQLTPKFPFGAKRVLFSDTYYRALAKPHVQLLTDPISSIQKNSIQTQNSNFPIDVLVYGTGFISNPFLLNIQIIGKDGISIQEAWKENPKAYLGMTIPKFPNLFVMYGPNTNLGHNSIIIMSEAQANYIEQCIAKLQKDSLKSLEIKSKVVEEYFSELQQRLSKMIWSSIDQSWYQSASGFVVNNFPGRTMEYMRRTKRVNFDLFKIEK